MLHPDFIDYISQHPELAHLGSALLTEPIVSVRYNLAKTQVPPDLIDKVTWCPDSGRYLDHRPAFTMDPALHQGLYYVQEASSMAIAAAVKELLSEIGDAPKVLDACAAPGGKTTTALSALPKDSVMVANEYDFRRAEILAENIAKWGYPNAEVSRGDTSKLTKLKSTFDMVIVDAPCSGEGMMRKDEFARKQWSLELVDTCAKLQKEILSNVWEALRPGGVLLYSTCTFNRQENERNVEWIVDTLHGESIPLSSLEPFKPEITGAIDSNCHCYRFLPGRVRGEGLFMAAVCKSGRDGQVPKKMPKPSTKLTAMDPKQSRILAQWLRGDYKFYLMGEDVFALPAHAADFMLSVASVLDVISLGVWVATIKGRDIVPAHALSLSIAANCDAFPNCEVDYDTAIKYLQRQSIAIDAPKGFVLLTYQDHPLGFVKNLGNRSNNLYPKNWRIRGGG